jgi:hypothetical protein
VCQFAGSGARPRGAAVDLPAADIIFRPGAPTRLA